MQTSLNHGSARGPEQLAEKLWAFWRQDPDFCNLERDLNPRYVKSMMGNIIEVYLDPNSPKAGLDNTAYRHSNRARWLAEHNNEFFSVLSQGGKPEALAALGIYLYFCEASFLNTIMRNKPVEYHVQKVLGMTEVLKQRD